MPVVAAIFGAILTGVIYWMMWGGGMEYVSQRIGSAGEAKRRETLARQKAEAEAEARRVALKTLPEPRDGAVALMWMVASQRGEPTTEQQEMIRSEMQVLLEYGSDIEERLALARHAVQTAPSQTIALVDLRERMGRHLGRSELGELHGMLQRVAALHGGPTDRQEQLLGDIERKFSARG